MLILVRYRNRRALGRPLAERKDRTVDLDAVRTAHCGYLSGVLGRPPKAGKGDMDTSVLTGPEAALAGLYAARRG